MLALADGVELLSDTLGHRQDGEPVRPLQLGDLQALVDGLENARAHYGRAILHHILLFDAPSPDRKLKDVSFVPGPLSPPGQALRMVMCDIAALTLAGMHELSESLQAPPSLNSPSVKSALPANHRGRFSLPSPSIVEMRDTATASPEAPKLAPEHLPEATQSNTGLAADRTTEGRLGQNSRDPSRDRYSVIGSRISTPVPKPELRRDGRLRVVTGAMLLQAGKWPEALDRLSEGAAVVRANSDYLWHARALEYILVCMLMLSWVEIPVQIPSVCYPLAEKFAPTKSHGATSTPGSGVSTPSRQVASEDLAASLQKLNSLIPDIVSTIFTLYTRASAFTEDKLPLLLFCEVRIRLARLLIVMHSRNGVLDKNGLNHLAEDAPLERPDTTLRVSQDIGLRKYELAAMLFKAIPETHEGIALSDSILVLVNITSLFSKLGLERKHAFILREVLSVLTPGLVEARKIGAAEAGIHPAAGLSALSSMSTDGSAAVQQDLRTLLSLMRDILHVPLRNDPLTAEDRSPSVEAIEREMQRWAYLQNTGNPELQMEALRCCITICEALPDLEGILAFSVQLLHIARRAITLPPSYLSGPPAIPPEDQLRLLNSLKRTVGAAAKIGLPEVQANYWDDFLVRGIQPLEPSEPSRYTSHSPQELALAVTPGDIKKDPFIYSSFTKAKAGPKAEVILAAHDMAYFAVMLQNPFEFDIEIDHISLIGEGCQFEPSSHSIVLGRYCSQRFILSGRPMTEGTLKITGCKARLRCCHERSFLIFSKQWIPERVVKLKRMGNAAPNFLEEQQKLASSEPKQGGPKRQVEKLEADVLSLKVVNAQPLLSVVSSTLSQPALMVLEGETKSFQIEIRNNSTAASADILLFSYEDSASKQLQDAIGSRELSPADLYELQLQLTTKPSLRLVSADSEDKEIQIAAGETCAFTFEIFGKPGLSSGVVQIDYAHLGKPRSDVREKFYTRQIRCPVSLTVNAGIEIPRCNILPFTGDFAWANQHPADEQSSLVNGHTGGIASRSPSRATSRGISHREDSQFSSLLARLGLGSHGSEHCLLLLDLRNVWPHPLSISIQVRERLVRNASPTDPWRRAYTVHEVLQPGHVSRVVLLVPRTFVRDPHASIPLIGNQRQFVVSASKISPEIEAANRESFWYREELLNCVRGSWREDSTGREGSIDIRRGIRLGARTIDALRMDDIEIDFALSSLKSSPTSSGISAAGPPVTQMGRSRFNLKTDIFATLVVKVQNRSTERLQVLLRLQPSMRNQPHNIALDLSKRFAWTGMLQRSLHPSLEPGEVREVELGVTALCEGSFEVGATVEETRSQRKFPLEVAGNSTSMSEKRRIWHAREPCLIDGVDS